MRFKVNTYILYIGLLVGTTWLAGSVKAAPVLPNSSDVSRQLLKLRDIEQDKIPEESIIVPKIKHTAEMPAGAKEIHFTLKQVNIEGMTAFSQEQMADIYMANINKDVALSAAWTMVQKITERYRSAGYFLSYSFVPEQSIKNGVLNIKVVEGAISEVEVPDKLKNSKIVTRYIVNLMAKKPITTGQLESFLLRINDLPGCSFRSVLLPVGQKVKLLLKEKDKKGNGAVSIDNSLSRYLGPEKFSANYETSFLPLQQTEFSVISGIPTSKMLFGSISHNIALAPALTLDMNLSKTHTHLGYNLEFLDINGSAASGSLGLNYQWIRQRLKNLSLKLVLDAVNSNNTSLGDTLSHDQIRALRAGFQYEIIDQWKGYNVLHFTVSKGINDFGASKQGNTLPSRDGAGPNYAKAEFTLMRNQTISNDWALIAKTSGQLASRALFAYEQFGYGGQLFGRAYDYSELLGDEGINGAVELQYNDLKMSEKISLQPYCFYDIGKVWQKMASSNRPNESGSSAGIGMRFTTPKQILGNMGIAWPLTRKITTPIYGGSNWGPRFIVQFTKQF
jgi:hemolysin activation/secretion protein